MVLAFLTIYSLQLNFTFLLKKRRLRDIVFSKTLEKFKKVDEETATFLAKSDKLQEFTKEQFDKNQVLINQKLTNLWIVCEESKMNNAEQELTNLTDEIEIASSTFRPTDAIKVRFLKEHCLDKIKEKEHSLKAGGVVVVDSGNDSLDVKGTQTGRKEMTTFLEKLAKDIISKVLSFVAFSRPFLNIPIPFLYATLQ